MATYDETYRLPDYQAFEENTAALELPMSGSELHGILCGYLCAGAIHQGESYLRTFIHNPKETAIRSAMLALFDLFTISQQQLNSADFNFQLLLPGDHLPITDRALAFSEWCEGFTQGIAMAGIELNDINDEEAQEALNHLHEFAKLDYQHLSINEEDEKALFEVSEYTKITVLRLHTELQTKNLGGMTH